MAKNAYFIIVAYDIPDDKRRLKVMNLLLDHGGTRVNYSVFECLLPKSKFNKMREAIRAIINKKEDKVRYYTLCESCIKQIDHEGVDVVSVINEEMHIFV